MDGHCFRLPAAIESYLDEVDARVELAQLVVAARSIGEDLNARQKQSDVRCIRREELLAQLSGQAGLACRHSKNPQRNRDLWASRTAAGFGL